MPTALQGAKEQLGLPSMAFVGGARSQGWGDGHPGAPHVERASLRLLPTGTFICNLFSLSPLSLCSVLPLAG